MFTSNESQNKHNEMLQKQTRYMLIGIFLVLFVSLFVTKYFDGRKKEECEEKCLRQNNLTENMLRTLSENKMDELIECVDWCTNGTLPDMDDDKDAWDDY